MNQEQYHKELTDLRLELGQYKMGCEHLETLIDERDKRIAWLEAELQAVHTRIDDYMSGKTTEL